MTTKRAVRILIHNEPRFLIIGQIVQAVWTAR